MSRTIVDIHVLQTVPPSNVNRDDTGSPKTATFGGVVRSRVSSQAWKRATRLAFAELLDPSNLGVRTKRLVELVAARAQKLDPSIADSSTELAEKVIETTGIKLTKAKRKHGDQTTDVMESGYLVFLSNLQIDQLARAVIDVAHADDADAAVKAFNGRKALDRDHSVDLALFGRMVADVTDLNVDACAQVAHAISVHGVTNEFDYFTAVDDTKQATADEDAGAGMIGTVEFNSSTLYRYATVDVDRLRDNLGDATATRRAVEAFVQAFLTSMPTGKQNTFANRTLPDAVVVMVRDTQPVNLVGAFENAVTATVDHTRSFVAATRLAKRAEELTAVFGARPVQTWALGVGDAAAGLHDIWDAAEPPVQWTTLPELPTALGQLVEERVAP